MSKSTHKGAGLFLSQTSEDRILETAILCWEGTVVTLKGHHWKFQVILSHFTRGGSWRARLQFPVHVAQPGPWGEGTHLPATPSLSLPLVPRSLYLGSLCRSHQNCQRNITPLQSTVFEWLHHSVLLCQDSSLYPKVVPVAAICLIQQNN